MVFSSIRQRLIITYFLLLLIVITPLAIILQGYVENLYYDTLRNNLETQAKIISGILEHEDLIKENSNKINDQISKVSRDSTSRITVISKYGTVLADTHKDYKSMESHLDRLEVQKALQGKIGMETRLSETLGKQMYYLALPIVSEDYVVAIARVSVPATAIAKAKNQITQIIILISLVVFLFGIGISIKMAGNLTTPIEQINEVAKKISEGKFNERVQINSSDEIGQLSYNINRMAATIQAKIEESLETNKRLKLILNILDSGVAVLDPSGRIRLANPSMLRIFHKDEKDLINKTLLEALRNSILEEKFRQTFDTLKKTEGQFTLDYPFKKYIQVSFTPIFEAGDVTDLIGVFHDVTSLKEVEKIRTQFVANASHELQTPLTAVMGFSETLLDGAMKDPVALEKFLQIINKEANRLQKIIDGLLKLSLLESETHKFVFTSLNIIKMLQEVVGNMEKRMQEASLTFKVGLPPRETKVLGDPDLLPQVFYNLLGNAIKYTPAGGSVSISLIEEFNSVKIIIEDTGIGIPEEDLARVFERFYRVDKARSRARGGTGLGLSIVKHIVDAHKGTINISSKLKKGTKFIITLPKG